MQYLVPGWTFDPKRPCLALIYLGPNASRPFRIGQPLLLALLLLVSPGAGGEASCPH